MDHFELPIAIYARYSTDLQNERSCEDQVIECKQYIERQDDLKGKPTEFFTDIYSCSVVSRWFSEGSYFLTWPS